MELHTDLAVEVREKYEEDNIEISGVELNKENWDNNLLVTTVRILDESGSEKMNKPIGSYITIDLDEEYDFEELDNNKSIENCVAQQLKNVLPEKCDEGILVVGLGNRKVTPDMLGPLVIDNLVVTRHIYSELGNDVFGEKTPMIVSAIAPGVMGQTGLEAVDIIGGILDKIKMDCVVVIDALASRSISRLNSTIQITNTGICPGSGVGNHRKGINNETLGKPVIAIGVPTVVDAYTIIKDSFSKYMTNEMFDVNRLDCILKDSIMPNTSNMIVTPKNIDESVRKMATIIAGALNGIIDK